MKTKIEVVKCIVAGVLAILAGVLFYAYVIYVVIDNVKGFWEIAKQFPGFFFLYIFVVVLSVYFFRGLFRFAGGYFQRAKFYRE